MSSALSKQTKSLVNDLTLNSQRTEHPHGQGPQQEEYRADMTYGRWSLNTEERGYEWKAEKK